MKRTLAITTTVLSLAAASAASAELSRGAQSTGSGAGMVTFNPFSITKK
jgi:hypothetical protein